MPIRSSRLVTKKNSSSNNSSNDEKAIRRVILGHQTMYQNGNLWQLSKQPKIYQFGQDAPWHRRVCSLLLDPPSPKRGFTKLYHSTQFDISAKKGDVVISPQSTFYHTSPNWTYEGNKEKAQIIVDIPVEIVEIHGLFSMAYFETRRNDLGYITVIMPAMMIRITSSSKANVPVYSGSFLALLE